MRIMGLSSSFGSTGGSRLPWYAGIGLWFNLRVLDACLVLGFETQKPLTVR
jgi:hypothetical protein